MKNTLVFNSGPLAWCPHSTFIPKAFFQNIAGNPDDAHFSEKIWQASALVSFLFRFSTNNNKTL